MINNDIGALGESKAVNYLITNGYNILSQNFRFGHKEIDIIAQKDDTICIIEVKTRLSTYIKPREAVNKRKQNNLIMAANEYITRNNIDLDVRFDIIEVIIKNKQTDIKHLKDAFYPTLE